MMSGTKAENTPAAVCFIISHSIKKNNGTGTASLRHLSHCFVCFFKLLLVADQECLCVDLNRLGRDLGLNDLEPVLTGKFHVLCGKTQDDIDNLLLVNYNVEQLDNIITPGDRIERLFINFCNPWPRERHKKRRLTYPRKLEMYKSFLNPDAEIRFKTDDDGLFEESVEYFNECGYEITYITRDLHRSGFEGNIMTEHEKMFSDEGKKIKFLIAKQK